MNVTELAGPRFALALERLAAGHAFTYDGVQFRIDSHGSLECAVASTWRIDNVTAETARADFDRAAATLAKIVDEQAFADLTKGRAVRMVLIEDYGNGAVELCARIDSDLTWAPGLPHR